MDETRASRTALGASLMRAVHTRLDRPRLIDDPWGDRLVPEHERRAIATIVLSGLDPATRARIEELGSPEVVLDEALRAHPGYGWAILRARYCEDALEAAVGRGVRQYVIVGAGMDSFALRQSPFARGVEVFEIDHPATQGLKSQRLRDCGVRLPETLHFVPADLGKEEIRSALTHSSWIRTEPTFFSWLGVTQYLTHEANLATLQGIAGCSAPGSELVFTYLEQRELDRGESVDVGRLRGAFGSAGEPWLSGFDPARLADTVRALGLALVEDLGGPAVCERYCRDSRDAIRAAPTFHIARVQPAARTLGAA
jgi:methyltransferase (TIGR00027 family)